MGSQGQLEMADGGGLWIDPPRETGVIHHRWTRSVPLVQTSRSRQSRPRTGSISVGSNPTLVLVPRVDQSRVQGCAHADFFKHVRRARLVCRDRASWIRPIPQPPPPGHGR
eukprot:3842146-Prymnesium_polylepis.3